MTNLRTAQVLAAVTFALLAASGTAPAQVPAVEPLRIGLIMPLTGGSADMGNSARVGVQVAINEMNDVGGFLGRPFELVVRDDRADPETGRKMAEELVTKEHVLATIGYCNTGVAAKSLEVFQKNQQVLIVPCATGTILTTKYPPHDSYIFRTAAPDVLQTQFLAAELAKRNLSKPALLVDQSGYGDAGLVDLQAALQKVGITPAVLIRFPVGVKNLTEELKRARASGADSLIGYTVGPESGVLAASRAEIGWKVPQFGPWGLSHRSAFEASHGAVEGTMSVQTVLPNVYLERNNSFRLSYRKLSQEVPIGSMMAAAQSYDAMNLLLRAMFETSRDFSGPALKKALENLPRRYTGVVTTYQKPFSDSDHDAISANMLWLGTWRNGERAYFYADDAKRAAVIRYKQ